MIKFKDHKTGNLFDQLELLGPKRRKKLEESWAWIFRKYILSELPVKGLAAHYAESRGRPTKEIYAVMGAVVLQQMFDMTDEETLEAYSFNLMWQYALDITGLSDADTYMSAKTLWTVRNHIVKDGLYEKIFTEITKEFFKAFKVTYQDQRIDSTHIYSNMRHLGRMRIFIETIRKFLTNLKGQHKGLYAGLDKELMEKYIKKGGSKRWLLP